MSSQQDQARVSMKQNKQLTYAPMNSILRLLNQVGPSSVRHRRRQPYRRGQRGVAVHRTVPRVALDLDRLCQIGGDPGVGTSNQAPARTPNPRLGFLKDHRLPPSTH
jgi:hypothetical protein